MDWELALRRNTEALMGLVALLLASVGTTATLPRRIYHGVLRGLGPAEAALRRLIVIAAREVVVSVPAARSFPAGVSCGSASRVPPFQLFDSLKRFRLGRPKSARPRISIIGISEPVFEALPSENDPIKIAGLARRLDALHRALADIPGQAQRLARWHARRQQRVGRGLPVRRTSPMRPGWPPGYRSKPSHPVDAVLTECHSLARLAEDRRSHA